MSHVTSRHLFAAPPSFAFVILAGWITLAAPFLATAQESIAAGKENLSELAPPQNDKTLLAPSDGEQQRFLIQKEFQLQRAMLEQQLKEVRAKLQKAEAEGSEEAKALAREVRRLEEKERELSTQYEVYLKRLVPNLEQLQPNDLRREIHALKSELKNLTIKLETAQVEAQEAKAQEANARQAAEETKQRLEMQMQRLAERERQFAEAMAAQQRNRELPPIENGAVKVFSLEYYPATDAVKTIESLFGTQPVRLAVDERTNSLIVFGKQEALPAVEELLLRLDQSEDVSSRSKEPSQEQGEKKASRSLLFRVFWLADGVASGEGQEPGLFLPPSVLQATERLGLDDPRLITQTVSSLAVQGDEEVAFSTSIPAALGRLYAQLECEGSVKLLPGERANVDMAIRVEGPIQCELSGSLVAPLGHYMVLGTASSLVPKRPSAGKDEKSGASADGAVNTDETMKIEAAIKSNEMGGGRGAYGGTGRPGGGYGGGEAGGYGEGGGGEFGGYGGGYGMEGGYSGMGYGMGGRGAMPAGGMAGHATNFDTSRFAFVVQVIESESYSAEAVNSDAKVHDHYRRPNGKPRE